MESAIGTPRGHSRGRGRGDRGGFRGERGRERSRSNHDQSNTTGQENITRTINEDFSGPSHSRGRGRGDRGGFRGERGRERSRSNYDQSNTTGQENISPTINEDFSGPSHSRGRGRGRGHGEDKEGFRSERGHTIDRENVSPAINGDSTDYLFNTINHPTTPKGEKIVEFARDRSVKIIIPHLHPDSKMTLNNQNTMRLFIQGALELLSPRRSTPSSDSGARLINDLSGPIGLKQLSKILRFPVNIAAGKAKTPMSFQYVLIPLFGLLTSEKFAMTMMEVNVNKIYAVVTEEMVERKLGDRVTQCLEELLNREVEDGIQDPNVPLTQLEPGTTCIAESFDVALLCVVRLLYQILTKSANTKHKEPVQTMVNKLSNIHHQWVDKFKPADDNNNAQLLKKDIRRLEAIINDSMIRITQENTAPTSISDDPSIKRDRQQSKAALEWSRLFYDPPGTLSPDGPRHDNDHRNVADIRVIPTQEEILSKREPFLPANATANARHFLEPSWEKQIDIHFRLFRHDAINSFKEGIQIFLDYLQKNPNSSPNGALRHLVSIKDVDLTIYPDVSFKEWRTVHHEITALIMFRQPLSNPKKSGRANQTVQNFWEQASKRLMQGALICLLVADIPPDGKIETSFHFGVVLNRDLRDLSRNKEFANITIGFADPEKAYEKLLVPNWIAPTRKCFLLETTGVFFEAYSKVLEALQNPKIPSSTLPFGRYLAPTITEIAEMKNRIATGDRFKIIDPPFYARRPDHNFDLSILLNEDKKLPNETLLLHAPSEHSRKAAEKRLIEASDLDHSQADALVSALASEVAIIQGPPGTGKTKVGVDIMRILVKEKKTMRLGPIIVICYTNHALDQFLEHLIEKGIEDIVRIGSRSNSEVLEKKNLSFLVKVRPRDKNFKRYIWNEINVYNTAEEKVRKIGAALSNKILPWENVHKCLVSSYPEHCGNLTNQLNEGYSDTKGGWSTASHNDADIITRWFYGRDLVRKQEMLDYLAKKAEEKKKNATKISNMFEFLPDDEENSDWDLSEDSQSEDGHSATGASDEYEFTGGTFYQEDLHIPTTDRPLQELLDDKNVWNMSTPERQRLYRHWSEIVRQSLTEELKLYLKTLSDSRKIINGYDDEVRREVISSNSVIGLTTNGAAKYQDLLRSVSPSTIIIEEAGEVIEAHTLASLSPSINHLILIGDHFQLRPQVATYNLSIESNIGKHYKLDISLFERLVTGCNSDNSSSENSITLPINTLELQRRMRPEISELVRRLLYPKLRDGPNTESYPPVRGFSTNLHFMDHQNLENENKNDIASIQSHSNDFEVEMVTELVKYIIKQGYKEPNDIAVLTPYLGQLRKLRNALNETFIVEMDERDMLAVSEMDQAFADADLAKDTTNSKVKKGADRKNSKPTAQDSKLQDPKKLNQQVALRTIDNFQGEEAKIVILSLVRNNKKDSIGFLSIMNRMNVALSRAQHGMFILGNAEMLHRKSSHWKNILTTLKEGNHVSPGFPMRCQRHPEYENIINSAHNLRTLSPNGGCQRKCNFSLSCGHTCPEMCHPQDLKHLLVKCPAECLRRRNDCAHICMKRCGDPCGKCEQIVNNIELPCGHVSSAPCWMAQNPSSITCHTLVLKKLPTCEHEVKMPCFRDPHTYGQCKQLVDKAIRLQCDHITSGPLPCYMVQNPNSITCRESVIKTYATCGHEIEVPCYMDPPACEQLVDGNIALQCGHVVTGLLPCWKVQDPNNTIVCHAPVFKTLEACGHWVEIPCHVDPKTVKCNRKCDVLLECGHKCLRSCKKCTNITISDDNERIVSINHGTCKNICDKKRFCQHYCPASCHGSKPCPPCEEKCMKRCQHQQCSEEHSCSKQYCPPCSEECSWKCNHGFGECVLNCGAPCTGRRPCNLRCSEKLECGHQCPSLCGEPCPKKEYCLECASPKIRKQVVNPITLERFEDLKKDSVLLVLSCGHCFTPSFLDDYMELGNFYAVLKPKLNDSSLAYYGNPIDFSGSIEIKFCPSCRFPIEIVNRYKRRTARANLELQMKKEGHRFALTMKDIQKKIVANQKLMEKVSSKYLSIVMANTKAEVNDKLDITDHQELSQSIKRDPPSYDLIITPLKLYNIPKKQLDYFKEYIRPISSVYAKLCKLIQEINNDPSKKNFDAAITSLYLQKMKIMREVDVNEVPEFVQPLTYSGDILRKCERESGIPSLVYQCSVRYVLLLQECAKIMLYIFDNACYPVVASIPSSRSWLFYSMFILDSAEKHLESMESVAASNNLYRFVGYAGFLQASVILRRIRLCNFQKLKDISHYEQEAQARINRVLAKAPEGILHGLVEDYVKLQVQIERTTRIAREPYDGVTIDEDVTLPNAMTIELNPDGHWHCCSHAHLYTTNRHEDLQEIICPECGEACQQNEL